MTPCIRGVEPRGAGGGVGEPYKSSAYCMFHVHVIDNHTCMPTSLQHDNALLDLHVQQQNQLPFGPMCGCFLVKVDVTFDALTLHSSSLHCMLVTNYNLHGLAYSNANKY